MLKAIQINFLFQYASLVLIILSIIFVVNYKSGRVQVSPNEIQQNHKEPGYLKTEILIKDLFNQLILQTDKLAHLKTFTENHNIDLLIEMSANEKAVQRSYQLSEALMKLGLARDSFTIKFTNTASLNPDDARLRLLWSDL